MRVLFLDIDGVLNSYQSAHFFNRIRNIRGPFPKFLDPYNQNHGELCPIAISNLEYILETLKDLKIVISSTWRLGCALKDLKAIFPMSELIRERIIDATPVLSRAPRGDEIKKWLMSCKTKVSDFAVLDDDTDMKAVEDNFYHCPHKVGLDFILAEKIISHFDIN